MKKKIFLAGGMGMVGSAVKKLLYKNNYNLITPRSVELDLTNQKKTYEFLKENKPDAVINCAAKVGGILANMESPYTFIMQNMLIQNNLIDSAIKLDIKKFIFLGSSCVYPKFATQPIKETELLNGHLESTNQWYAIAKISGIKSIEAANKQFNRHYNVLMPPNLFGENDTFHKKNSHVVPSIILKMHEAKLNSDEAITLWGTGTPKRELMDIDELADCILFFIKNDMKETIYNVGSGEEISIRELAQKLKKITGYKGKINWDKNMPDGTPRKLMCSKKVNKYGWKYSGNIDKSLEKTYSWFKKNYPQ